MSTLELVENFRCFDGLSLRSQLLGAVMGREGSSYTIDGVTVHEYLLRISRQAGVLRLWATVRYCSSLLHQLVDSISPYITGVLVNGKQVSVT